MCFDGYVVVRGGRLSGHKQQPSAFAAFNLLDVFVWWVVRRGFAANSLSPLRRSANNAVGPNTVNICATNGVFENGNEIQTVSTFRRLAADAVEHARVADARSQRAAAAAAAAKSQLMDASQERQQAEARILHVAQKIEQMVGAAA